VVAWLIATGGPATQAGDAVAQLIGRPAGAWEFTDWLNSPRLKLEELKGKVVLIRWWTAPGCSYCQATAPALNEFHADYHAAGLEVIGAYHHKVPGPVKVETVKELADGLGFKFPVAVDPGWKTLKRWWLSTGDRDFTSVSFLIDRHGVVRHIHPGGQFVKGDEDYAAMKRMVEELLAEK